MPREWTFMIYLAGDNDLEVFGRKDLAEIKAVGSSEQVTILAQFDTMSDKLARRYLLSKEQTLEGDCIAQLAEVNTGDPDALSEFILWACKEYPARKYGLVLWNHGTGWKDDDIYRIAKAKGVTSELTRGKVRRLSSGKKRRALFSTTIEKLILIAAKETRAILFDDSSADFLDNLELRAVLCKVVDTLGRPLDLIGFDACLMNMLEVHFQIRDLCVVAVGSQENEPGDGWPYHSALQALVQKPTIEAAPLAEAIVHSYLDFYANYSNVAVTQSAIRLAEINALAGRVSLLAQILQERLGDRKSLGEIFATLRMTQSFADHDYIDLGHFCHLLANSKVKSKIRKAAAQVAAVLSQGSPLTIAEGHCGPGMDNACGLSIYLPIREVSPLYAQLEFAKHTSWDEFLEAWVKTS